MFHTQPGIDHIISEVDGIKGSLNTLPPIRLQLTQQSFLESLWDHLVHRYHYLSYQNLLGHRLKYQALMGGALGKVENCQSGVFVGYTSKKGYGLLTSRLYLPEVWFSKEYEKRRKDNGVPEDLDFQTKIDLAYDLIQEVAQTQLFPARWIGFDATFGSDLSFLESLPKEYTCFASIRSSTQVFLKKPIVEVPACSGRGPRPKKQRLRPNQPDPQPVADIPRRRKRWQKIVLAEGAKGPIVAEVARLRIYPSRKGLPTAYSLWLFLRRSPDGQIKYAFSNAPNEIPLSELCQAATLRWPIEQCFEEGKGPLRASGGDGKISPQSRAMPTIIPKVFVPG